MIVKVDVFLDTSTLFCNVEMTIMGYLIKLFAKKSKKEVTYCFNIWRIWSQYVYLHHVFHSIRFLRLTKVGARRCSFFFVYKDKILPFSIRVNAIQASI